jgi:uncharacterized membrane protein YhaH (DUF805 family)
VERTPSKERKKMEWYLLVWKRFAEFDGRSRRKEYWMFSLFNFLIALVLEVAGLILLKSGIGLILLAVLFVYALAALIPSLAVSVRRLHDIGKSGWWLLIALVPIVGGLLLLVFSVMDSEPGMNEYGPIVPAHK